MFLEHRKISEIHPKENDQKMSAIPFLTQHSCKGRLGSGRWVVSLFFVRCNLHEAVIHFTSYNATAQRVESEKPGRGGGTVGSPAGPVPPPCPSNCVSSFAASVRAKLPQRWEGGWGTNLGVDMGISCNLAAVDFWGGHSKRSPRKSVSNMAPMLRWYDLLRWTDGGLEDLQIWDNLSGVNALCEAAWCWFLFLECSLMSDFRATPYRFLLFGKSISPLSICGWQMFGSSVLVVGRDSI